MVTIQQLMEKEWVCFERNTKEGDCHVHVQLQTCSCSGSLCTNWALIMLPPKRLLYVQPVPAHLDKVDQTFDILIGQSIILCFSGSNGGPQIPHHFKYGCTPAVWLLIIKQFCFLKGKTKAVRVSWSDSSGKISHAWWQMLLQIWNSWTCALIRVIKMLLTSQAAKVLCMIFILFIMIIPFRAATNNYFYYQLVYQWLS